MKDKVIFINGNTNIIESSNVTQTITIDNSKNENEKINEFLKILETEINKRSYNDKNIEDLKTNIEMLKLSLQGKDDNTKQLKYKILEVIGRSIDFIPKAVEAYIALKRILPIGGE